MINQLRSGSATSSTPPWQGWLLLGMIVLTIVATIGSLRAPGSRPSTGSATRRSAGTCTRSARIVLRRRRRDDRHGRGSSAMVRRTRRSSQPSPRPRDLGQNARVWRARRRLGAPSPAPSPPTTMAVWFAMRPGLDVTTSNFQLPPILGPSLSRPRLPASSASPRGRRQNQVGAIIVTLAWLMIVESIIFQAASTTWAAGFPVMKPPRRCAGSPPTVC